MRKTAVPHFGQTPLVAGRLFFSVTFLAFWISTFFFHFTQYACAILSSLLSVQICAEANTSTAIRRWGRERLALRRVREAAQRRLLEEAAAEAEALERTD